MTAIYLIPAKDPETNQLLKVRLPDNPLTKMSSAGVAIVKNAPFYTYWLRRISDGSVVKVNEAEWKKLQPKKTVQKIVKTGDEK